MRCSWPASSMSDIGSRVAIRRALSHRTSSVESPTHDEVSSATSWGDMDNWATCRSMGGAMAAHPDRSVQRSTDRVAGGRS